LLYQHLPGTYLPILSLAKEVSEHKLIAQVSAPLIHCNIFEDNSGTVEMANVPKMQPCTKHIAGEHQIADIFTKALDLMTFLKHRKSIMDHGMVAHAQLNRRRGSLTLYWFYVRRSCSMITYDHARPIFKMPGRLCISPVDLLTDLHRTLRLGLNQIFILSFRMSSALK
jgi:hypothetical protein